MLVWICSDVYAFKGCLLYTSMCIRDRTRRFIEDPECRIMIGTKSVSYTHLDVYKRQWYQSSLADENWQVWWARNVHERRRKFNKTSRNEEYGCETIPKSRYVFCCLAMYANIVFYKRMCPETIWIFTDISTYVIHSHFLTFSKTISKSHSWHRHITTYLNSMQLLLLAYRLFSIHINYLHPNRPGPGAGSLL